MDEKWMMLHNYMKWLVCYSQSQDILQDYVVMANTSNILCHLSLEIDTNQGENLTHMFHWFKVQNF
jgi:hypothetical protein